MNELFSKTFSELTTAAPLDIRGLGDKPLTVCQLTGLWAVVNHRSINSSFVGFAAPAPMRHRLPLPAIPLSAPRKSCHSLP